jgi:hypothetical protein
VKNIAGSIFGSDEMIMKKKSGGAFMVGVATACAALLLVINASADVVVGASTNTVVIGAPTATDSGVDVPVTLNVHGVGPSIVIFYMQFDASILKYVDVERGAAATGAGKYAEAYTPSPGLIKFIVFALNANEMDSGLLLTASFSYVSSADASTDDLLFAGGDLSMSSSAGVSLDSRILYFAPETVTVSGGSSSGALVEWSTVPGAAEYLVFRASENNPDSAEAISNLLDASQHSFEDVSEVATSSGNDCMSLYYWVAARSKNGFEGTLSESALWSPGSPSAPDALTVASSDSNGVSLQWSAVDGATGYRVFRGITADSESAIAISDWLSADATTYLDENAVENSDVLGCFHGGGTYYYWVKARNDKGCESILSASAAGEELTLSSKMVAASVTPRTFCGGLGDVITIVVAGLLLLTFRGSRRNSA